MNTVLVLAIVAAVIWGAYVYSALRIPRPSGSTWCRKCAHCLDGIPRTEHGWTCPECGTVATTEKQLRVRLSRARRLAIAALLAVVLTGLPYAGIVWVR
jgi:RNase P subunit RPR2